MCWWVTALHQEPYDTGAGKKLQSQWESGCRNMQNLGASGPSQLMMFIPRYLEGSRTGVFTLSFVEAIDLHVQLFPEVVYLFIQLLLV